MAAFSTTFSRLRQDLDQAHENRQQLLHDIQAGVREMARQTGEQLAEQGRNRRAQFAAMMTDLRSKLNAEANQTRSQLAELAADLHQGGQIFRTSAGRKPAFSRATGSRKGSTDSWTPSTN